MRSVTECAPPSASVGIVRIAISRLPSTGIAPATMLVPPRSTPTMYFSFGLIRAPVDEEPAVANWRCIPPTIRAYSANGPADTALVHGDDMAGMTSRYGRPPRDAPRGDR